MSAQQSPPFTRRQLGRTFRGLREQAGMSFKDACQRLEISAGRMSRLENGETAPDIPLAKTLLDLYGITVNDWEPYLELAREAKRKGYWQAHGLPMLGYVALETAASSTRTFTLSFVPGLMQIEEYARAIYDVSLMRRTQKQMDGEIAVRMIRQLRLRSMDDRLDFAAIVDETALVRPIGSVEVMRAQLRHMLDIAALPTVTLQVLPKSAGAHLGMHSAFTILSFPDHGDMVYIEHVAGALQLEKEEDVRVSRLTFERLRTDALNPADSLALIERLAAEL